MRLKNKIEIPEKDAFKNCKLGRGKNAIELTKIIKTFNEGFVLAIDTEWGTGKTTFVEMWRQYLKDEGFLTGYFNAWESDYEISPLGAILAEIKEIIPSKENKNFKKVLDKAGIIAQKILPAVGETLAKKYLGENYADIAGGATGASVEILEKEIDRYIKRQKGIVEFKTAIEEYLSNQERKFPIVFFVDELDRCRPSYSVEILEQIKHFFEVKGIVFVLSIDKVQLGNAIKGFYGSEHLDTEEYLRRFIDVECTLPRPNYYRFCKHLLLQYAIDDGRDARICEFLSYFFENRNLTLRQQEKIIARVKIISHTYNSYSENFLSLVCLLLIIYTFDKNLYLGIKEKTVTLQGLIDGIEKLINPNSDTAIPIGRIISILLAYYHHDCLTKKIAIGNLYADENFGKTAINVNTKLFNPSDSSIIANVKRLQSDGIGSTMSDVLEKIDIIS